MIGYYIAAFLLAAIATLLVRWVLLARTIKRTMLRRAAAGPERAPERCEKPSQPIFATEGFERYALALQRNGFSHIANGEGETTAAGHRMWGYMEIWGSESRRAFAVINQVAIPTLPHKTTRPSLTLGTYFADGHVLQTTNMRARWTNELFRYPTHVVVRNIDASTEQLLESHGRNQETLAALLRTDVSQELTWEFWRARIARNRERMVQMQAQARPYRLAWQYSIPQRQCTITTGDTGIPASKFVLP